MRKLVIILALAAILCGGCGPKELITLTIPGTTAQILMRLIPAGSFMMGSPDLEEDRKTNEGPQHMVTITEPFYMGVYEVTQEQWEALTEENPSWFVDPANPVNVVSWGDCQDFIAYLNTKGIGTFRLPTEAEWEYACRAGSLTRFYFGDDLGYSEIGDYAWYISNSSDAAQLVGQKLPNQWGLYDMHGNVYEWCSDFYGAYESTTQIDPQGPSTGFDRILRGGSWGSGSSLCRSASRHYDDPSDAFINRGFRLVMTMP